MDCQLVSIRLYMWRFLARCIGLRGIVPLIQLQHPNTRHAQCEDRLHNGKKLHVLFVAMAPHPKKLGPCESISQHRAPVQIAHVAQKRATQTGPDHIGQTSTQWSCLEPAVIVRHHLMMAIRLAACGTQSCQPNCFNNHWHFLIRSMPGTVPSREEDVGPPCGGIVSAKECVTPCTGTAVCHSQPADGDCSIKRASTN